MSGAGGTRPVHSPLHSDGVGGLPPSAIQRMSGLGTELRNSEDCPPDEMCMGGHVGGLAANRTGNLGREVGTNTAQRLGWEGGMPGSGGSLLGFSRSTSTHPSGPEAGWWGIHTETCQGVWGGLGWGCGTIPREPSCIWGKGRGGEWEHGVCRCAPTFPRLDVPATCGRLCLVSRQNARGCTPCDFAPGGVDSLGVGFVDFRFEFIEMA